MPRHPGERHQLFAVRHAKQCALDLRSLDPQQEIVAESFDPGYLEPHLRRASQFPTPNFQLPRESQRTSWVKAAAASSLSVLSPNSFGRFPVEVGSWGLGVDMPQPQRAVLNTAGSIFRSTRKRLAIARN